MSWTGTTSPPPFDLSNASTFLWTHFRLVSLSYNNTVAPNAVMNGLPGLGLKCAELAPPVDVYQVSAGAPGGWRSNLIGSSFAATAGFFEPTGADAYYVSDYPKRLPGTLTILVTDSAGNTIPGVFGANDTFHARLQFYNKFAINC